MRNVLIALAAVVLMGCATWASNTRTGLLMANAGLNGYDDVAAEVFKKAATNTDAKEHLGVSLCATLLTQQGIVDSWAVVTMVDEGQRKKSDLGVYAKQAVTVLTSLKNYLEAANITIPSGLLAALTYMQAMSPGLLPQEGDPLAECGDILAEKYPSAGLPWGTIITSGTEMALFLAEIIKDAIGKKEVSKDALEQYLRTMLKQEVVYEGALGGGSP